MTLAGRRWLAWAVVLLFAAPAPLLPYAHFLYQERAGGDFRARAFDLVALPDGTVRFFVSPDQPVLRSNDSYPGLISQIRAALSVWDDVPTSALRVEFRGIRQSPASDPAPYGEILFAELPPGVLGLGGPMTSSDGGRGPIVRSQVFLSNDLTTFSTPRAELFGGILQQSGARDWACVGLATFASGFGNEHRADAGHDTSATASGG